jgi:hypothetical protein
MVRITITAFRGVCVALAVVLAAWEISLLLRWGVPPWPSGLWFAALLAAIYVALRLPRATSSRISFGSLFLFASVACGLMWRRETPAEAIAVFLAPLGLGFALLILSRALPPKSPAGHAVRAA